MHHIFIAFIHCIVESMEPTTYFEDMYFLLKWVYVETIPGGEYLPHNGISLMYIHGEDANNIWLNDFLHCYLNENDCILCSTLISQGFKLWIKCIHPPQLRDDCEMETYAQPCFLCIKCRDEEDVPHLKECLIKSPYKFITLNLFPWPQSAYYEDTPKVTL